MMALYMRLVALTAILVCVGCSSEDNEDERGTTEEADNSELCKENWDTDGNLFFSMGVPSDALPVNPGDYPAVTSLALVEPQVPAYSSLPGANRTIYLDFNGNVTSNTAWNNSKGITEIVTPPYDVDGDPTTFSADEQNRIREIFQRVAEDYAPFDVNVTTVPPAEADLVRNANDPSDTRWGIRVAIGGSASDWYGSAGGVAYVGVFGQAYYQPAFVFSKNLGPDYPRYVAEAVSHEAGHTLGLSHKGLADGSTAYYPGSGSGETAWAPIMGVGYYRNLTTWSNGFDESTNPQTQLSNPDDEISKITGNAINFAFRADQVGDSIDRAAQLTTSGNQLSADGLLEKSSDADVFKLTSGAGTVSIQVKPANIGPNLDVGVELLNSQGTVVARDAAEDDSVLAASLTANVPAGDYFVRVVPHSFYGRLGWYKVTGSFTAVSTVDSTAPTAVAQTLSNITAASSQSYRFSVRYTDNTAVKVASLDAKDVQVVGPQGNILTSAFLGVDFTSDGAERIASYEVQAPGGSWDTADNGSYTLRLVAGEVMDTAQNSAAASNLGSFTVNITQTPPPSTSSFMLGGRITLNGKPLSDVLVDGRFGMTVRTDTQGNYLFSAVKGGTLYSLVPSKAGYLFTASSTTSGTLTADSTANNFAARCASGYKLNKSGTACVARRR